jgi:hypothetical protein
MNNDVVADYKKRCPTMTFKNIWFSTNTSGNFWLSDSKYTHVNTLGLVSGETREYRLFLNYVLHAQKAKSNVS